MSEEFEKYLREYAAQEGKESIDIDREWLMRQLLKSGSVEERRIGKLYYEELRPKLERRAAERKERYENPPLLSAEKEAFLTEYLILCQKHKLQLFAADADWLCVGEGEHFDPTAELKEFRRNDI